MKFDQFDNDTQMKDLKELKEEVTALRRDLEEYGRDLEEYGKGISALIDALYTESGNLRNFSDTQTRDLVQSALKILQNTPTESRLNDQDRQLIQNLSTVIMSGIAFKIKEEDKTHIAKVEKDLKKIRDYFWWVFYGVAAIFFMLGIWSLKVILTSFGQWLSS